MEIELLVNRKQRSAYIPKALVKSFGHQLTILPNQKAALLYPSDANRKEVLASVRILEKELALMVGEK